MLHTRRRWCVADYDNAEEIACGLSGNTQVLCTGIRYRGLLILNDATSEAGGQEYAVIEESTGYQVESLTCSWMKPDKLRAILEAIAEGRDRTVMVSTWTDQQDPRERIENLEEHGTCSLCR